MPAREHVDQPERRAHISRPATAVRDRRLLRRVHNTRVGSALSGSTSIDGVNGESEHGAPDEELPEPASGERTKRSTHRKHRAEADSLQPCQARRMPVGPTTRGRVQTQDSVRHDLVVPQRSIGWRDAPYCPLGITLTSGTVAPYSALLLDPWVGWGPMRGCTPSGS
jgi:hypothetical protein